jgi:hypothetical protein
VREMMRDVINGGGNADDVEDVMSGIPLDSKGEDTEGDMS